MKYGVSVSSLLETFCDGSRGSGQRLLTDMKAEFHVTNATRFRFLKTNPEGVDYPVIVSEQSQ